MKFNLKWIAFIMLVACNAKAQSIVLTPGEANFFRNAYYKGQRDSSLLHSSLGREMELKTALDISRSQISAYKRDSVRSLARQSTLLGLTKVSIDSTAAAGAVKVTKVKKVSGIKTWIIVGLITLLVLK